MKSETMEYRDGDVRLKAFITFDDSRAGKRLGILVNPEAFGFGPQAKSRAERLAQFGYVAAYFDGDSVTTTKKGVNPLERGSQVDFMADFQEMVDFPPAPKLDVLGKLIPAK